MSKKNFPQLNYKPLYLQIKDELSKAIANKKYKYGERLPSELELSAIFRVSRSTIREAIKSLAQEGLVTIKHGLGTFVTGSEPDIKSNIAELHSITKIITQHGWVPGTVNAFMREEEPTEELIERLQMKPGDKIIHIERVRTADGRPVFYTIQKVVKNGVGDKLLGWDMEGSINDFLEKNCGIEISYTVAEILPLKNPAKITEKMGIPEKTPILLMDQIQYDNLNRPLFRSFDFYRTDIFHFNLIRKRR